MRLFRTFFRIFFATTGLLFASATLLGQGLSFSNPKQPADRTSSPKDWLIPSEAEEVGIDLQITYHPSDSIEDEKGYLFIDKEEPLGGFSPHHSRKVWVDSADRVDMQVNFKEAGRYAITYLSARKEPLARDTVTIHASRNVFFCRDLDRDKNPVGRSRKFYPSENGLYRYYICASSTQPLDTHKLITKVYKYKVGDYRQAISTAEDHVNHEWRMVFFLGPMLEPGQYRVALTKANGEPFATGYFELMPPKATTSK